MDNITQDTASNLWLQTLQELQKKLNPQIFERWFSPTRGFHLQNNTLTVHVPDSFFKEWLIDHYTTTINDAVRELGGRELLVEFEVDPGLNASLKENKKQTSPPPSHSKNPSVDLNPQYTLDQFVVGPSNRFAHAAATAVCESPAKAYNPLFIYGPVGLGKTHLMQAIGAQVQQTNPESRIRYITSEKFTNQLINAIQTRTTIQFRELYRNVDILLIDDIHFIAGKESTQEEFFHTFNTLYDAHKQIVVSSDRSPKEISRLEERLVSRFEWGLITDIQPPDFETRIAILRQKAKRNQIEGLDEVTYFIAEHVKSNIRELEGALIRVVAYSKLVGHPITVKLAQEVLKDLIVEAKKKVGVDLIQEKVAEYFKLSLSDLKAKRRTRMVAHPRQIAMYISRELTDLSLPEIGDRFGKRDHTTVLHACNKIKKDILKDSTVKDQVGEIISSLKR